MTPPDSAETPAPQPPARAIDLTSLKALAHPLRIGIWQSLSMYGPATSSTLAQRLGESSGLMSYHLRTLAKHGFIEEMPDHGTARERWWRSVPGRTAVDSHELAKSAAGRAALDVYMAEMGESTLAALRDFERRALTVEPAAWVDAAAVNIANASMTVEELHQLGVEVEALLGSWLDRVRGRERQTGEHTRPVQIHFNAFPLSDPDAEADR